MISYNGYAYTTVRVFVTKVPCDTKEQVEAAAREMTYGEKACLE
jgi:hypothetical protein